MAAHRTEELVVGLRRAVVEGRIAPGEKLPGENELIAAQGVRRTVVREAITARRAAGLVRTREESLSPLGLRTGIEAEAAGLAASRRAPEDLAAMRDVLEAFRSAADGPAGHES